MDCRYMSPRSRSGSVRATSVLSSTPLMVSTTRGSAVAQEAMTTTATATQILLSMEHPPLEIFTLRVRRCHGMIDIRVQLAQEPYGAPGSKRRLREQATEGLSVNGA